MNFSCWKCADDGCLGTTVSLLIGLLYMQVCNSLWKIVKIKTCEMSVWAEFAKISSRENFYIYSIQKLTMLEHKNGLVLSNTHVPVSGTWSILFSCNCFHFWKSYFKMALIKKKKKKKKTYLSHFLVTRGKKHKNSLQHISHLHTYTYFAHPIDFFFFFFFFCRLTNFAKIKNVSCMVSLWCDSWCWFLFAPFLSK